jgi:hypothetical protein
MTPFTHDDYVRLRQQTLFLADVMDLLLVSLIPRSRVTAAAGEAVRLLRTAITVSEAAAKGYADTIVSLNRIGDDITRMRVEGRRPTHIEWESLRARMEAARRAIAASANPA